jgi:hypothetical protein
MLSSAYADDEGDASSSRMRDSDKGVRESSQEGSMLASVLQCNR